MKITVRSLSKSFGSTDVVKNVSFFAEDGELLSLLGPSGCGKTTVLRIVAGLETATSGEIWCGDTLLNNVSPHLRGIGMVFQSYALWPHKTVFKNVAFPLEIQKCSKDELKARVEEVLRLVDLSTLQHRYPHELSGGQQQRVALARALAQKPKVLLLDEPLSNLDAKLRDQMRKELKNLQRSLKLTMLYVTHDRTEALELSHKMAILDRGSLIQIGTPEEIMRNPANEFVAHFVG